MQGTLYIKEVRDNIAKMRETPQFLQYVERYHLVTSNNNVRESIKHYIPIRSFSYLPFQVSNENSTKAITDEIRVYFFNSFEILEMMRKMVSKIRLDMNILIRDEGDIINKKIN